MHIKRTDTTTENKIKILRSAKYLQHVTLERLREQ